MMAQVKLFCYQFSIVGRDIIILVSMYVSVCLNITNLHTHITQYAFYSVMYCCLVELLCSYNDEDIYLFDANHR